MKGNKMGKENLHWYWEYVRWFFGLTNKQRDYQSDMDGFKAGWEAAKRASEAPNDNKVRLPLAEFIAVVQRYPDVIGHPVYYAQWPTEPDQLSVV
jgi:hypothetical protein